MANWMHTKKHVLCNLCYFIYYKYNKRNNWTFPAAYTAVTTPDMKVKIPNHQLFCLLTMSLKTANLQFCFTLLKWMEIFILSCFLWKTFGVFTNHLYLKQDSLALELSKSTHVGFHMTLHCKINHKVWKSCLYQPAEVSWYNSWINS